MLTALERVYAHYSANDNHEECARAAFWCGLRNMLIGEVGLGSGWLQRAAKHAEQTSPHCVQIGILSLWPIRRRSLAATTIDRHILRSGDRIDFCLYPEDTKGKRMESWPVPDLLLPHLHRYLDDIRPRLLGRRNHGALWVGLRGTRLQPGALYDLVVRRTADAFGTPMALHDFRRAAATFLAMDAPEIVGLTPGILQHTSPDIGNRNYNLSRSVTASRRHARTVAALKTRLRPSPR